MKNLTVFFAIAILFFAGNKLQAQNFTVTVPVSENCWDYLKPVKAGTSFQLKVRVANKNSKSWTIELDKNEMNQYKDWVDIANNNQNVAPNSTITFLLTISVPSSTIEGYCYLNLSFKAKSGNNTASFDGNSQIIDVDNTPPDEPTFYTSSTSTTIKVAYWESHDTRSAIYATHNPNWDYSGIENYTIVLKNSNNSVEATKIINATENIYEQTFSSLTANTKYKVSVKATDLAGNSKSTEKIIWTAPAKPRNLTFSNTSYISTVLSWSASAGATGYDVYMLVGGHNQKITDSPVSTNSYTIDNLNPNTSYTFNVIAKNNTGESDRSNNASVKTLPLPRIIGSPVICTGNYTYSLNSLFPGYTVSSWSHGSNISYVSSSGISAVFTTNGSGSSSIGATILSPNGVSLILSSKEIWLGKPDFTIMCPYEVPVYMQGIATITYPNYTPQAVTSVDWSCSGAIKSIKGGLETGKFRAGKNSGSAFVYALASNACGSVENRTYVEVIGDCYRFYPNPANDYVVISFDQQSMREYAERKGQKAQGCELVVYDAYNQIMYKTRTKDDEIQIDTRNFPAGTYYLHVTYGDKTEKSQLVIE